MYRVSSVEIGQTKTNFILPYSTLPEYVWNSGAALKFQRMPMFELTSSEFRRFI
jgi:hypothetical protein